MKISKKFVKNMRTLEPDVVMKEKKHWGVENLFMGLTKNVY